MTDTTVVAILAALAGYIAWCTAFPFTKCPWCSGKRTRGDGRGNYRMRGTCRVCGGGHYRRLGARLIGRGR